MAYVAADGTRYPSTFDPILERALRINVRDANALTRGIGALREMLAAREREELPSADGVRFARWRIAGSIANLRLARGKAPDELHAVLDEVIAEALRAHDAAPDFERRSEAERDPGPVADWVPAELGGPVRERPAPRDELAVVRIDLDGDL